MLGKGSGKPIIVGSFDDRFNMVGGLTFKQRMAMLRGIDDALRGGGSDAADEERYALWAVLKVNHDLMAAKGLTWRTVVGEHDDRMRPGSSVVNLLPAAALRPDIPGPRIARLAAGILSRLERELFGEGVFASNQDIQAAALRALVPDTPAAAQTPRRRVPLPDGRGTFSHKTIAHVLRYYGLGRPAEARRRRGYLVASWHLHQLVSLTANVPASLDLRVLPWRHGAYALVGAQS